MPRPSKPADLRTLIYPQVAPAPGLDPCPAGWPDSMGRWAWYQVRGFREAVDATGVRLRTLLDEAGLRREAVAVASQLGFPAFCPVVHRDGEEHGWSSISSERINEVYHGRAHKTSKNEPKSGVTFPKAVLAILTLDLAATRSGSSADIYSMVTIEPCIYLVDGIAEAIREGGSAVRNIIAKKMGVSRELIDLLSKKRSVSYATAAEVSRHGAGFGAGEAIVRNPLGKPNISAKPNHHERFLFPRPAV